MTTLTTTEHPSVVTTKSINTLSEREILALAISLLLVVVLTKLEETKLPKLDANLSMMFNEVPFLELDRI